MMAGPTDPRGALQDEPEAPVTDNDLEDLSLANGLDVWAVLGKVLGNVHQDGTLANAQLWSLRQAVRAELIEELTADLLQDGANQALAPAAPVTVERISDAFTEALTW